MSRLVVQATTLSLLSGSVWKGALILGQDSLGKSGMILSAAGKGCVLISGDHTVLWSSGGHLYAAPSGDTVSSRALTRIHLAVLAQSEGPPAPHGEITQILGHAVPTLRLNPHQPFAAQRLITLLRQA